MAQWHDCRLFGLPRFELLRWFLELKLFLQLLQHLPIVHLSHRLVDLRADLHWWLQPLIVVHLEAVPLRLPFAHRFLGPAHLFLEE
jgi:hypothetical protein